MPTLPPIVPERTTAGIAVDPRTLERVVPQTKRSDGSVRKELKIRPGFTPQEDVGRFKGTRQQEAERNTLPKGHIVGWVPPSQSKSHVGTTSGGTAKVATTDANGQPLSKAALKNAKRKAKKIAEKANNAGGSALVFRAQDSEEEEEKVVVGTVDDAPDAWDEEGDEEAPAASASPAFAKGKQNQADPGVSAVAKELDKLAV